MRYSRIEKLSLSLLVTLLIPAMHPMASAQSVEASFDSVEPISQEQRHLLFGQQPPGSTAEVFAPGLVSTDALQALPAYSPDLSEFFFLEQVIGEPPVYHVLDQRSGAWASHPIETTQGPGEVFISPDNTRMHLGAQYRDRTQDGWSQLRSLGAPFTDYEIMRLTASDTGTYVFDERDEFGLLRYSRLVGGERQPPQVFGGDINAGSWTAHPFIAPDESFLIFDSNRNDGYGNEDLYISFRNDDGSWGEAINLGETVNSEHDDIFGSVTPDGRYLFFSRINLDEPSANILWVDASAIHELRKERTAQERRSE